MVFPFSSNPIASLRPPRGTAAVGHSLGEQSMFDDVVHLKNGTNLLSLCGIDLGRCLVTPALFVGGYHPERTLYQVQRLVSGETSYPLFEQVSVSAVDDFCETCLSDYGLRLLCLYNARATLSRLHV